MQTITGVSAVGTKGYDFTNSLYNPNSPWLLTFRSKLAAVRAGGSMRLLTVGDSITAGYYPSGTVDKYTFQNQMRLMLAGSSTQYPIKGSMHYFNHLTDPKWTETGTITKGGFGMGAQFANAATIQYVSTDISTQIDVYYLGIGAYGLVMSDFTVQIDGGTPVNVHPDGSTSIKTYTVSGLAATTHTVKIVSGGANCYLIGFRESVTTSGLQFIPAGQIFTKASDWQSVAWYDRWAQATVIGADAYILGLGVNDSSFGVTTAQYKIDMANLITRMKPTNPGILLTVQVPPLTPATWPNYVTAQYELADEHDIPLLDFTKRWKSHVAGVTNGMFDDQAHPTALGYCDMAQAYINVLTS